jgi:hypothetical protein
MSDEPTRNLTLEAKVDLILERLGTLETKQYDTRPIWEQVLQRLESIDREISRQDAKLDNFIEDVIEMKRQIRRTG